MQVIGGQRQRCRVFDQLAIELSAALHLAEADAGARDGQIFIAEEIAHPFMRGVDLAGLGEIGGGQARLFDLAETVGEFGCRTHERRLFDRDCQLRVELFDHIADRQLGFIDAAIHTFAETVDRAIVQFDVIVVPLEVVLVILGRLERGGALAAGKGRVKGVEARKMVDRAHQRGGDDFGREALERLLLVVFEHIVSEPVGSIELRLVDRRQQCEILLRIGLAGGVIFVFEEIADPVGIAHIAAE